jgi:hypothetical protein
MLQTFGYIQSLISIMKYSKVESIFAPLFISYILSHLILRTIWDIIYPLYLWKLNNVMQPYLEI